GASAHGSATRIRGLTAVRASGSWRQNVPLCLGLSEPPAGEYADFVVGPVGRTGGAADEDRSIGIAAADRCAAVVDFLLLVDEREIELLDRLVSDAHIEVLVLEIRGHILAQLRLIV